MNRTHVDLYEGIMTTRSMHRFTDEPIADHVIWDLLKAAQQVPSGGLEPPIEFVVVTDPTQRGAVADQYRSAFARYEAAFPINLPDVNSPEYSMRDRAFAADRHLATNFENAPVIVAVAVDRSPHGIVDENGVLDLGGPTSIAFRAVQNLALAARSRGLGTSVTAVFRIHHHEIRDLLGIPTSHDIAALIPIGHPKGEFAKARRAPIYEVTHWNSWGDRRLSS